MSAQARALSYSALAEIFRPPTNWPAEAHPAGRLLSGLEPLDEGLALAWRSAFSSSNGALSPPNGNLIGQYHRLFVGPLPAAHPYESVYRTPDNRLMGEITTHVRRAYAEAGLAISDGYRELPDHVSVELEFMAWLANEEAVASEDSDDVAISFFVERQAAFLQTHLSQWIPDFCHRVVVADESKFYSRAAAVLAAFVVIDLEKTQARWQRLRSKDGIRAPLPLDHPVGIWSVDFREERPSYCTLCGICAEVCRPVALSLDKSRWEVELKYDAARCDGCGYCVEYCPERILKVESATRQENTAAEPRRLAHSAIHPCRKCGKPVVPEALLSKVVQRFQSRQGSPTDEASMYLCAACKPGTALKHRSSIGAP